MTFSNIRHSVTWNVFGNVETLFLFSKWRTHRYAYFEVVDRRLSQIRFNVASIKCFIKMICLVVIRILFNDRR